MTEKDFVETYTKKLNDKVDLYIDELKTNTNSDVQHEIALRFQKLCNYFPLLISEIAKNNNLDINQMVYNYSGTHEIPYSLKLAELSIKAQWEATKKFNDFTSQLE
jgi:hypothetical protein